MGMRVLCLFLVLNLSLARILPGAFLTSAKRSSAVMEKLASVKRSSAVMEKPMAKLASANPLVKVSAVLKSKLAPISAILNTTATGINMLKEILPKAAPDPDTLEPGFSYSQPVGSGCTNQPEWAKTANISTTPLKSYKTDGWDGFCQINEQGAKDGFWLLCPDARRNQDYTYYAKGLGEGWARAFNETDGQHCQHAGFLKPEIYSIVHNFTALQAKGEELCNTKFAVPFQDTVTPGKLLEQSDGLGVYETAIKKAAGDCALGDLSCSLAYCNFYFCEKADGSVGHMEECGGWDKVHGVHRSNI